MPNVHDAMEDKLAVLYGTASLGDGYAAWVAEHGPEWEDLLAYTEAQSGTPGWDGWCLYWDLPAADPASELLLPGVSGSHVSTSEITLANATAIDVRYFGTTEWNSTLNNKEVVSQSALSNQAFCCRISTSAGIILRTGSGSGSTITTQTARTPSPIWVDNDLYGVRWTWSGTTVRYYLADDPTDPDGTTWTQVGADVTITAPSMGGTSPVRIGAGQAGTAGLYLGTCRQVHFYKNGSLVASPDFTIQAPGTTSFDDAQGVTWTVNGTASIALQS